MNCKFIFLATADANHKIIRVFLIKINFNRIIAMHLHNDNGKI